MNNFCQWSSTAEPTSWPSTTLGYLRNVTDFYDFTDSKQLGKGGFGIVRSVKKRTTGERFACKEIRKTLDAAVVTPEKQQRHLENVRREVSVLKKLKGSLNIINLEAAYEDQDSVYIITECCSGGELIHTIGIRPYSEQTVARVMKAVLRTLSQCHGRGILHRDIKPGNFMFLKDDVSSPIKAIDFGLAVFFEEDNLPRRDLGFDGTPWFMAPEVLSSNVVPASDVWSAGVMAYQLLSGYLPFDDKKCRHAPALSAVWKSVLTDEPEFKRSFWQAISGDAKDFIKLLLKRDIKDRPTAMEALSHVWITKGAEGEAPKAHLPHTLVQRIQRFGQASLFKRTVLDMIANELLQSYVEKTRYNEQQFLKRQKGTELESHKSLGGGSCGGQTQAIEIIKGFQMKRRWGSMADLEAASSMSIEDWDMLKQASRLELDTSNHGSEDIRSMTTNRMQSSNDTIFPFSPPRVDSYPPFSSISDQPSSVPKGISLQAVLEEKEPLIVQPSQEGTRTRGHSLYKDYMESRGQSLQSTEPRNDVDRSEIDQEERKKQRVEQFMKSVFGVENSNETRKVIECIDLGMRTNVTREELMEGLDKIGYEVEENEMSHLVEIIAPGSAGINLTQFVASQIDWEALQETHRDTWLSCVHQAFESIDRDCDGSLSAADIVGAIEAKLPNKDAIDAALEQARAETCAAELNMSFEDFLAVLSDDRTRLPLKNFESRYHDVQPSSL